MKSASWAGLAVSLSGNILVPDSHLDGQAAQHAADAPVMRLDRRLELPEGRCRGVAPDVPRDLVQARKRWAIEDVNSLTSSSTAAQIVIRSSSFCSI